MGTYKKIKFSSKYDYAYSVGRVRALETLLLKDNEMDRMMLGEGPEDVFKILNELDFADNKAGIKSPSDFQKVLDSGLKDIKDLYEKILPNKKALDFIFLEYDFHNIKTFLKAKLSGKSVEEIDFIISDLGTIKKEALRIFIFDEKDAAFGLPENTESYLKKKIRKAEVLFKKENQNPEVIDLYLDQKMMKILFGIAKDLKSEFLVEYIRKFIDLNNIKLFFRMKHQDKELHLFEIAFIWNGTIPYEKFKSAYKEPLEKFPEIMKASPYGKIISTGYQRYVEEQCFIYLEREIENYLLDHIRKAKQTAFGPEPVVAYFLANKNNALIIRMIMINKLNGISAEEIQKRIRKLY
ncbi:MAG: V-type ATPase subunit [Candidatus Gracilibacteria bacterium]|nr:V-type ATPase subunit [Candidatus Gracilibacteria bacterium]